MCIFAEENYNQPNIQHYENQTINYFLGIGASSFAGADLL